MTSKDNLPKNNIAWLDFVAGSSIKTFGTTRKEALVLFSGVGDNFLVDITMAWAKRNLLLISYKLHLG